MKKGVGNIKPIPNWYKAMSNRCYFCGETRSVKYFVELNNVDGKCALTVDACNRCVLRFMRKDGADNDT